MSLHICMAKNIYTSHSNLPFRVSSYNVHAHAYAVSTCNVWLPRHMQGSWTCQQPVVRLTVCMSSVTEHFIDPTLNGVIHQCLFICPFHNGVLSFILRKRMGEVIIRTVTDNPHYTHSTIKLYNPIPFLCQPQSHSQQHISLYTQPHVITPHIITSRLPH